MAREAALEVREATLEKAAAAVHHVKRAERGLADAREAQSPQAPADAEERHLRALRELGGVLIEYKRLKKQWVAAARKAFVPSRRSECFVCRKYRSITQAHHVVPLTVQYDRGFKEADHEHVWLCPNHHTIIHFLLIDRDDDVAMGRAGAKVLGELEGLPEYEAMLLLLNMSGRHP